MRGYLLITVFILIYSTCILAKLYPCDRKQVGSSCYIENITIGSNENHASVQFEEVRRLVIELSSIPIFSQDLFANMHEVEFLSLKGGSIVTVDFISDELNSLRIDKTGLRNLSIAPEPNYNLNTLLINRNPLSVLPSEIRFLFGLSILDLSQNRIEYVNLSWFQRMVDLLILDLSWNHIAQMDAGSDLRLPRLRSLFVNVNHLTQIPWFPIGFPALEQVRMADNYWKCAWVASMRQQIWDRHIKLFDSDGACSEDSEGGLCCYHETTGELPVRYELIDIEIQQHQNGVMLDKVSDHPPAMMAEQRMRESTGICENLEEQIRTLQRDKLSLMKKKAEMEQRHVKKIISLQEILRSVREDLEAAERELSRLRYQERLNSIKGTSAGTTESIKVVGK